MIDRTLPRPGAPAAHCHRDGERAASATPGTARGAPGAIDPTQIFVWSGRVEVSSYVRAWFGAFVFTQAVEVPIWAHALREQRDASVLWGLRPRADGEGDLARAPWPTWAVVAVAFGASAITHPFVWFAFPRFQPWGYWAMVLQAEVFAVVVEAVYMRAFGLSRALGWSLVANGASAGLGMLSRSFFDWP
jgi:hypothetical protein